MQNDIDYPLGDFTPNEGEPTELAPGVLWLRFSLPFALDHINLYALDDGDGWVLVDCGVSNAHSQGTWETLLAGPLAGRPVKRIIVTHFHPDHIGSAGWLVERTGADLAMSRLEWEKAQELHSKAESGFSDEVWRFYASTGIASDFVDKLRDLGNVYRPQVSPPPANYQCLSDGDVLQIGGNNWRVITGAGHSPEHVCLLSEEAGLMIGGDMLLPRITPIIGVWEDDPTSDPLADYISFLRRAKDWPDGVLILPSHNRPYHGLHARARYLLAHHDERLGVTLETCAEASTAHDVMLRLFTRELDAHSVRFAASESLAHIHRLLHAGSLQRSTASNGIHRYAQVGA